MQRCCVPLCQWKSAEEVRVAVSQRCYIWLRLRRDELTANFCGDRYLLTLSSFQILYGKLSDIYGRRNLFLFAYVTFGLGCLFCGLSQTMIQLILSRVVVGIGGGGFITLSVVVISDLVPLRRRGTWQALRNLMFAVGLSAGSMGGIITDKLGWRW